jgi:protein regulator of cytokinesis 1
MESISWLCAELGIPLPNPLNPIPPMDELPYPRARTKPVKDPSDPFVDVPLPDPQKQREEYYPIFAQFVAKLQEAEDEDLDGDFIGVEKVEPSLALMDWFERLQTDVCAYPFMQGTRELMHAFVTA